MFDYLVVGAGFAGATIAERLRRCGQEGSDFRQAAAYWWQRVRPLRRGRHPRASSTGLTSSTPIHARSSTISRGLPTWRPYQHRVLACVDGQLLPIPINLDTVNRLYGTAHLVRAGGVFQVSCRTGRADPDVGGCHRQQGRARPLRKFFRNYTRKQWGLDPSELDAMCTARVPVRTNRDDRYFTDTYQAMPLHGYTRMFERMLSHPNIKSS